MMNGARRHTRRGGRQHSRTGCRGMVTRGSASTPVGLGLSLSGRNNKGHVYGFGSRSAAVTAERWGGSTSSMSSVPSVSSSACHKARIERERRLWGYMQQTQERFAGFMTSFTSQCIVQLDLVPTLFPPFSLLDNDATSQPPTSPPFFSPSPPPPLPAST
ncbi:hypothetical protein M9H77_02859 [Catharanthus roseus]|uniref:Uncharacterized protein n=1 Tax=Catharanthus roseus TaxID=4058 RepID=A0ACC0C9M4_CATRO|nr:hypothetical protein M9H77_02859 [Catharanthus roseus]